MNSSRTSMADRTEADEMGIPWIYREGTVDKCQSRERTGKANLSRKRLASQMCRSGKGLL